jgi:hypothetical protein
MAEIPIFVSKPSKLSFDQDYVRQEIYRAIADEDLLPRTVGDSDVASQFPLKEAAILARACYGGLILGFRQTMAPEITEKFGTDVQHEVLGQVFFPTPWNQIEAGMLFALRRPLIVLAEQGIKGGIFDHGSSDKFISNLPGREAFESHRANVRQVIRDWAAEVRAEYRRWG